MSSQPRRSAMLKLESFGLELWSMRRIAGIRNLRTLSQMILEETGESISPKTLYRIEHGETVVTLPQLMAIDYTLNGKILSTRMKVALKMCTYLEWL